MLLDGVFYCPFSYFTNDNSKENTLNNEHEKIDYKFRFCYHIHNG